VLRLIVSRLAGGVAVLAAVATITFLLLHAAPGGPFSRERRLQPAVQRNIEDRYHLHDPLWQQYGRYMSGLAKGDLGHSMKRPETVGAIIKRHFPYSLTLGLMAIGFAAVFGTLLGVLAAARRTPGRLHGDERRADRHLDPSLVLGRSRSATWRWSWAGCRRRAPARRRLPAGGGAGADLRRHVARLPA
jgi:hypothetical protein